LWLLLLSSYIYIYGINYHHHKFIFMLLATNHRHEFIFTLLGITNFTNDFTNK